MELVEIDALEIVSRYVDSTAVPISPGTAAHLLIEVDGNYLETLLQDMESIAALLAESLS